MKRSGLRGSAAIRSTSLAFLTKRCKTCTYRNMSDRNAGCSHMRTGATAPRAAPHTWLLLTLPAPIFSTPRSTRTAEECLRQTSRKRKFRLNSERPPSRSPQTAMVAIFRVFREGVRNLLRTWANRVPQMGECGRSSAYRAVVA